MLKYIVNGKSFTVRPEDRDAFEEQHPGFKLAGGGESSDAPPGGGMYTFNVGGHHYKVAAEDKDAFIAEKEKEFEDKQIQVKLEKEPEFNHITEAKFFKLSETGWFNREETIVPRLREIYKYKTDGTKSNIRFEESHDPSTQYNAVKIYLPGNDYGEVFSLPHSDDVAEVSKAYIDITNYIKSVKKKPLKEKKKSEIENVFTSRPFSPFQRSEGIEFAKKNLTTDPIFQRDENIAEELTKILGGGPEPIEFEAVEHLRSAVKVTLFNGNSKVFNVNASNDNAKEQIINFIETDSKGYRHTKKFKEAKKAFDTEVDNMLAPWLESVGKGLLLGDASTWSAVKRSVMNQIGAAGWQQLFFADKEQFQNLSRDDKGNFVEYRLQEILNNAREKLDNQQANGRDYFKSSYHAGNLETNEQVGNELRSIVRNSYTGTDDVVKAKQNIHDLNFELYDDKTTPERREEILGKRDEEGKLIDENNPGLLAEAITLREEKEGDKIDYDYYMDPVTGTRELTQDDGGNFVNLGAQIEKKKQEIENNVYTIEELESEWKNANLAHMQTVWEWKNKKRWIPVNSEHYNTRNKKIELQNNFQDVQFKDGYALVTDAQARRMNGLVDWLDLDSSGHASRLDYLGHTTVNKDVYNKMYALNEGLLSQPRESFGTSVLMGFKESVGMITYGDLTNKPAPAAEMRQAYLDAMMGQGMEVSGEEKAYAKTTFPEISGRAIGGIPKLMVDFWVANKAVAVIGSVTLVNNLIKGLKAKKYLIGGKRLNKAQAIKHMKTTRSGRAALKNVPDKTLIPIRLPLSGQRVSIPVKGNIQQEAALASWITANPKLASIVKASFGEKLMATALMANFEGIKMEIAFQDPLGLSGEKAPIGSSYATGVGFGAAGQLIPWSKMWKGLTGKYATAGIKLPFTKKQIAYKGFYDYFVAAPVNFYIGARVGELSNAIVDDMMGNKTWNNFLEDHYGDFDENIKHGITDLITGFAMKMGHFNRFDFASETRLQAVSKAARVKRNNLYEKVKNKETKKWEIKVDKDGQPMLKKGNTQEDVEKYSTLEGMADIRLHQMRDTQDYLDGTLGPIKLYNDFLPTIKGARVKGTTKFHYDFNMEKGKNMNHSVVKAGDKGLFNHETGKYDRVNNTKKDINQFVFNPKNINPGLAPHELGHFGLRKLFTEDVMFKGEFVHGMRGVMENIKVVGVDPKTGESKEMSLWQAFKNSGVWKPQYEYNQKRVKEEEMFTFLGEYLGKEGNLDLIREHYGFDRLAGFLEKTLKDKFGQTTNLNTEKEIVQFFSKYIETIGEGKSVMPNIKSLERFVSRNKTENQRKRRIEWEKKNGQGETVEVRSEDLGLRIEAKEKELKTSPFLQQYKDDKITLKEYKEKTKQIQSDLKEMRENLENMPKEVEIFPTTGFETRHGAKINNFAKTKDGKLMTNEQWQNEGKWNAVKELQEDGGAFDGIITSVVKKKGGKPTPMTFPVKGRSRETWIEDVKFGIEGKQKNKFVDKGIYGILERFKPETDLEGNESLSAWVNRQYQFRRGNIFNHYDKNPVVESYDIPITGRAGEAMVSQIAAGKEIQREIFEEQDITQEWIKNKKGGFKEIVTVEGDRKLKNELPIDKTQFGKKGGWKETVIEKIPQIQNIKEVGSKHIGDLAPEFTWEMYGIKLTESQKKNLNDLGQPNLKILQEYIAGTLKVPIMEKSINLKTGLEQEKQKEKDGELVFKTVENAQVQADLMKDATIKFDEGVSEKLKGTSNFTRLGVLAPLYHKATAKDYTQKQMEAMGYMVNPTPRKGVWRAATGPGGDIWLRGPEKGKDITGDMIKELIGIKPDGTFTTVKENSSLNGIGRRLMDVTGGRITHDISKKAVVENPNLVGRENLAIFLLNTTAGTSRKYFSESLEMLDVEQQREFMLDIQSKEFSRIYAAKLEERTTKGKPIKNPLGKALREYFTTLGPKSSFSTGEVKATGEQLMKIGEQLETKLGLEGIGGKMKALKTRVAKTILFPQSLRAIEKAAGVKQLEVKDIFNTIEGIKKAKYLDGLLMEWGNKKYGPQWYETILHLANTSGTGIGGARKAIYETAEEPRELAAKIKTNRSFDRISRPDSNRQGTSVDLRKYIEFVSGKAGINEGKVRQAYEHAEINKEILRDVIDVIKDLYDSKKIDNEHVRAFLEVAGGPVMGLIRKSGSLAIIPKGTNAELFKMFPEKTKKIGKDGKVARYKEGKNKGKVIWEQGWVLEHTLPTQYVKARIYEYLLSGEGKDGEMYENMDLTLKDFHTTFIPKGLDKMVNTLYLSELNPEFMPGMDPLQWRYFRNAHPSNFNLALRNIIEGKEKDYDINPEYTQTRAQAQAKMLERAHNKLFGEIGLKEAVSKKLNSEKLDDAASVDKALANGRKLKEVKKGMSAWDFDDTLARTKSGVRYRLPNPSGEPAPQKKVIFMAGGPGSGKSTVTKGLDLKNQGFKIVNQDISLEWLMKNHGLPTDMKDFTPEQASKFGELGWEARMIAKRKQTKFQGKGDGIIVDGTGNSLKTMESHVQEFKNKGYDVQMVFVETSLETALQRNRARKERSLRDGIVIKTYESVQNNKEAFRELFGDNFAEVKTDNLKIGDSMPFELTFKMDAFTKGYIKGRLDPGEYADKGEDILKRGGEFDFSEFDYVKEGKKGPLFGEAMKRAKKYGVKDQFIVTARPHAAKLPIYRFLDAQGLNIPFDNIITLENSAAEAKALWVLKKFAEGYNDIYFADDAMQNIKAVKNVLDQLDIKSKVQQAKRLHSENLSEDVNDMMEHSLGVESGKRFSKAEAKIRGKDIKRRRVFIPDSAADLELLIEPLYGKGKKGIANKKWFEENFYKPWERGVNDLNTARQTILNDYMALRKNNKDVVKLLDREVEGTNFTNDQAMRVYIWNKNGFEIPDLASHSETKLVEHVKNNPKLQAYAETVASLTKIETGLKKPIAEWWAETLASEVSETGRTVNREKYIGDWIEIKNEMFSEQNLNKMESKLGTRWRGALEDMFDRMETGRTRSEKMGRIGNKVMNYLNGSVGAIMNLNMRSATLQLISSVNFINHAENNPLAAARAFANQPQYWKDFMRIMNSDMLLQRRAGLKINVTEAELAAAAEGGGNKAKRVISWILKQGYIPTKIADSFAIASGGATYLRNRIRMYEKQGLETKEAEKKAWIDFQSIAEKTQQSSRADLLSQQQTSLEGRLILPFANTPMQMNRIMMKEILDISKGRYKGWFGENSFTNKMSKITYYGAVQSLIFAGLQSAMFALMANGGDDEMIANKKIRTVNTMTDSFLRGMGIQAAVLAAFKNAILKFLEQNERGFTADYGEVAEALLNISPTIGSKYTKMDAAGNTYKYNEKEIKEKGFSLSNTPAIEASAQVVEAITNIPVHRVVRKTQNVNAALNEDNEAWQRLHNILGWSTWDVGIEKKTRKKSKYRPGVPYKQTPYKQKAYKPKAYKP